VPVSSPVFAFQNQNQLLFNYAGALGGKTGFTDLARHTYVGAAQRGNRRLVVTLLGAEAWPQAGWEQGAALLDWGFGLPANVSVGKLVEPGQVPPTPLPSPTKIAAAAAIPAVATDPGWSRSMITTAGVLGIGVLGLLTGLVQWIRRPRRR
jgi:D-alanyl-D-alanine carboxypeptidase (penicillin-binding protein 5/6)